MKSFNLPINSVLLAFLTMPLAPLCSSQVDTVAKICLKTGAYALAGVVLGGASSAYAAHDGATIFAETIKSEFDAIPVTKRYTNRLFITLSAVQDAVIKKSKRLTEFTQRLQETCLRRMVIAGAIRGAIVGGLIGLITATIW